MALAEALGGNRHDGVGDGHVPEHGDVLYVRHRVPVDHDVVHDARSAPAAPPRPADETRAAPPRDHRLAPAERDPGQGQARGEWAAEEDHERRSVDRPHDEGTRRPPPGAIDEDPAAVVIGRPAPRGIVHPGPLIPRVPDPAPRAVGRPAGGPRVGSPDRPIALHDPPAPVAIEVAGPGDTRRHVAAAHGPDELLGARIVPAVPRAELWRRVGLDAGRVRPPDDHLLVRREGRGCASGGDERRPPAPAGDERGRVRGDVHAIVAGALDGQRRTGRVELHRLPGRELAQVERGMPGGDLELDKVGLVGDKPELRSLGGPHEGTRADLDLDIAARTRVEEIAGGERRVELGRRPVRGARPPERDLAVDVADAGRRGLRRPGPSRPADHDAQRQQRADDALSIHGCLPRVRLYG